MTEPSEWDWTWSAPLNVWSRRHPGTGKWETMPDASMVKFTPEEIATRKAIARQIAEEIEND